MTRSFSVLKKKTRSSPNLHLSCQEVSDISQQAWNVAIRLYEAQKFEDSAAWLHLCEQIAHSYGDPKNESESLLAQSHICFIQQRYLEAKEMTSKAKILHRSRDTALHHLRSLVFSGEDKEEILKELSDQNNEFTDEDFSVIAEEAMQNRRDASIILVALEELLNREQNSKLKDVKAEMKGESVKIHLILRNIIDILSQKIRNCAGKSKDNDLLATTDQKEEMLKRAEQHVETLKFYLLTNGRQELEVSCSLTDEILHLAHQAWDLGKYAGEHEFYEESMKLMSHAASLFQKIHKEHDSELKHVKMCMILQVREIYR
mmetsp:Transcript_11788/g.18910  ORF Transcript_11788/g.18910 Transcript_11788/m.18910 type:complete len:317 (-) Transcript_11788:941-1891(-)